jgi:hypothetical protein
MNPPKSPDASMASRQQGLMDAIEAHLASHPQAADSASGVARWWLGVQGIHAEASEVEAALAMLVTRHALRQARLADGTLLYSRIPPAGAS